MELTYRQLETILSAHLQIKPDRLPTFRSRIKQLQRLEFPGGVNVGRGAKMVYTGEHLFKLVSAFELIGIGLPADRATTIVNSHWEEFAAAYALSLRNTLNMQFRKGIYARLIIRAMAEIQFHPHRDAEVSKVIVEDHEHLSTVIGPYNLRSAHCYPVVCASDLVERVLKIAQEIGGVRSAQFDIEVLDWLPIGEKDWLMLRGDYSRVTSERAYRYMEKLHGPEGETAEAILLANQEEGRDGDDPEA